MRQRLGCDLTLWAPHSRVRSMPVGNRLRVQSPVDAVIRWAVNDADAGEVSCRDSSLGAWFGDLDTERVAIGSRIQFAIVPRGQAGWSEIQVVEVVA